MVICVVFIGQQQTYCTKDGPILLYLWTLIVKVQLLVVSVDGNFGGCHSCLESVEWWME